jgi:hypothetical protein
VGDQSRPDHGLVEGYDDHRWGVDKVGTFQEEALCDRTRHAAEHSFYLADKGVGHRNLDSMTSSRIGQVEVHGFGNRRNHDAEGARADSLVEGGLQVYDSLWRVAVAGSRSTYHAEDSFGKGGRHSSVRWMIVSWCWVVPGGLDPIDQRGIVVVAPTTRASSVVRTFSISEGQ